MRKLKIPGLLPAMCLSLAPASAWGCDARHAYNRSNGLWRISFSNDSTCSTGGRNRNVCDVDPGESAEIHYELRVLGPDDVILSEMGACWRSRTCTTAKYHYNPAQCYLWHDGNTYPFVLNSPTSGDITFVGSH